MSLPPRCRSRCGRRGRRWNNHPHEPPERTIRLTHGTQISHLIQSILRPFTALLLTGSTISCIPPPGHTHPHQARPRNSDETNISPNMIRLPLTIPFMAPSMMTYGERKFIVIGKDRKAGSQSPCGYVDAVVVVCSLPSQSPILAVLRRFGCVSMTFSAHSRLARRLRMPLSSVSIQKKVLAW